MVMVGGKKVGGYLSLMGGFLLHLTLGTLYCFGNMNTYMTSYLRTHVKGQVRALLRGCSHLTSAGRGGSVKC